MLVDKEPDSKHHFMIGTPLDIIAERYFPKEQEDVKAIFSTFPPINFQTGFEVGSR